LGENFESIVQDSFLEYFFLEAGRFEKRIALSEKKGTFSDAEGPKIWWKHSLKFKTLNEGKNNIL
jgi:hypothetical protein